VLALLVAGLGGTAFASQTLADEATPAASASPAAARTATVDTKNFAFAPSELKIATGTKVTFTNSDPASHTVTSADSDAKGKAAFDSGDLAQNASWSHVFDKAGTYKYFCAYHTYMKGTIVVTAPK
jgi:plastocyanin